MQSQNTNKPFIAIWMVTYNQEKFISQAIESVLMQKCNFSFKLYIGEDCSTDRTKKICKRYQYEHPDKIELLLNKKNNININAINTYNACLNSESKYIAMLEGDDYWTDPNKLQKQVDFLEVNQECAFCYTNTMIVYDDKPLLKKPYVKIKHPEIFDLTYLLSRKDTNIHTSSVVFRKKSFPSKFPKWFSNIFYGDIVLYVMTANKGYIGYIDEVTTIYRVHDKGVISNLGELEGLIQGISLIKNLNAHLDFKYNNIFKKSLSEFDLAFSIYYLKKRDIINFINYFFKSHFKNPLKSISDYRDYLYKVRQAIKNE